MMPGTHRIDAKDQGVRMDIPRALHRYRALLRQSVGLKGKLNAIQAIYYYTILRFSLWGKPKLLELNVNGHRFSMDLGRKELASILEVLLEKSYEPDEGWVTHPGDVVFDIGSNIGVFAILQGKRIGSGRVFAFEPSPTIYPRLRQNIALNRLENVETFQMAMGDREGKASFVEKPISLTSHVTRKPTGEASVEVEEITLDAFVRRRGIERIDLLKIDAEGHELPVLAGGGFALTRTSRVVLEIHRPEDEALARESMERAGFTMTLRDRDLLFFQRVE
jgi:FkbM family methyltransferase